MFSVFQASSDAYAVDADWTPYWSDEGKEQEEEEPMEDEEVSLTIREREREREREFRSSLIC